MTRGKCPFDKKVCKDTCVLYRKGFRYFDDPNKKPKAFEDCALNIAVDCLENLVGRSIGQQKATEQTRNETAALKQLFFALAAKKQIEQEAKERMAEISRENVVDVSDQEDEE